MNSLPVDLSTLISCFSKSGETSTTPLVSDSFSAILSEISTKTERPPLPHISQCDEGLGGRLQKNMRTSTLEVGTTDPNISERKTPGLEVDGFIRNILGGRQYAKTEIRLPSLSKVEETTESTCKSPISPSKPADISLILAEDRHPEQKNFEQNKDSVVVQPFAVLSEKPAISETNTGESTQISKSHLEITIDKIKETYRMDKPEVRIEGNQASIKIGRDEISITLQEGNSVDIVIKPANSDSPLTQNHTVLLANLERNGLSANILVAGSNDSQMQQNDRRDPKRKWTQKQDRDEKGETAKAAFVIGKQ